MEGLGIWWDDDAVSCLSDVYGGRAHISRPDGSAIVATASNTTTYHLDGTVESFDRPTGKVIPEERGEE